MKGNRFLVGICSNSIMILKPPFPHEAISKEEALNLAAYLISLTGASTQELEEALEDIGAGGLLEER